MKLHGKRESGKYDLWPQRCGLACLLAAEVLVNFRRQFPPQTSGLSEEATELLTIGHLDGSAIYLEKLPHLFCILPPRAVRAPWRD